MGCPSPLSLSFIAELGQTVSFTCVAGGSSVLAELISSPRPAAGLHCKWEGNGTSSTKAVEAKVVKSGGSDESCKNTGSLA